MTSPPTHCEPSRTDAGSPHPGPVTPAPEPIEHYENFPVASWLCPPHLRAPISAIYHFARTADDIADEGNDAPEERLHQLAQYRQALHTAASTPGPATATATATATPYGPWAWVFEPLQAAIAQYRLPVLELHALLDAFTQDTEKSRDGAGYATEDDVLGYCAKSANPVGRLLLHLYGVTDATALRQSDAICSALQLINFWQDLSVDIPRGRNYLSDEVLQQCGVARTDVLACKVTPATTLLVRQQVQKARDLMLSGAPLVHRVPGRAGWELRLVVQGGLRIADKIASLNYGTLQARPALGKWDIAVMVWRALWMRPGNGRIAA